MTRLLELPIRPAIDGDYLTSSELRGVFRTDHVRADCGSRAIAFYCLSCRVTLANPYQLELHAGALKAGCVVAKLCQLPAHGPEALTL